MIPEMENTLEETNSRLGDTEYTTDLQDRIIEITQLQQ